VGGVLTGAFPVSGFFFFFFLSFNGLGEGYRQESAEGEGCLSALQQWHDRRSKR